MLFRKSIDPACAYCTHAYAGEDDSIICTKKGIMQSWQRCRSFVYDPLKRRPEAPLPPVTNVDPDAFRLPDDEEEKDAFVLPEKEEDEDAFSL